MQDTYIRSSGVQRYIYIIHVHMCACMRVCVCVCVCIGGQQQQIRIVQLPRQQGVANAEDVSRRLREQEEEARRVAEENHRKAQLRTTLSTVQVPQVHIYTCIQCTKDNAVCCCN